MIFGFLFERVNTDLEKTIDDLSGLIMTSAMGQQAHVRVLNYQPVWIQMTKKHAKPRRPEKRSVSGKHTEKSAGHLLKRAISAHREGRFAEAEKGYGEVLKKKPDWGRALNALGVLFLDQSRPDRAKAAFEKSAGLNPPDLSACYNLGRMRQQENDHRGAVEIYRTMLERQPDIGEAWNNLGVAYREMGEQDEALSGFQKAVAFAPDMAEAWNNLGVAQDELNLIEEASNSYQKAIEIQPDYASAHLNLGVSLQRAGQFKEAEVHYNRVLEMLPDNETAKFMLQSIGTSEPPDAAPVDHVRSVFDQCAHDFETILVNELEYKTPELLFDLVRPHLTQGMNILDLGCGTGLGAQLYHPFARSLTGVDVSAKMLEKAAEKKIYSRLECFDLLQEWKFPHKFDLIYSSDVFVYFGNLDTIIRSVASYLVNGGIIAFSVERLEDDSVAYQLFPSGRYAHSETYVHNCLTRHGLKLVENTRAAIRKQSGNQVEGILMAAVKKADSQEIN